MSMQEAEAQRQISQMVNFILNEARDKAQEIEARALEEFNIEKLKLVQHKKNQVRQEYQQKAKRMETERAIARSNAINRCRLRKIGARNAVLDEVVASAKVQLAKLSQQRPDEYLNLCSNLIAQACLMLLEHEVLVRVRPEDKQIIQGCLSGAQKKVSEVIERETGVRFNVKITIDPEKTLSPGPTGKHDTELATCSGGVIVTNMNRKITVDNTLDTRLTIVMKDKLPDVRSLLFPVQ